METGPRSRPNALTAALACVLVVAGFALSGPGGVAADGNDFTAVDAHVQEAMAGWGVPGLAYGVVQDGRIVHLAAFGTADGAARPMTPQTPLVIGSVGKSITALAIRQLVEAGRVDPDASVTRYLPWFSLAGPDGAAQRVTIRALLDHTSGLSTALGQDPRWYGHDLSPEEVVRGLDGYRADGTPGQYAYSNMNYVILGVVIEAVSGLSYGGYVEDRVFGPLGMEHSATSLEAAAGTGQAQGHRYLFGVPVAFDEPYPGGMVPAGYHVSTAEDMARFAAALSNGGSVDGVDVVSRVGSAAGQRTYGTDWQPLDAGQANAIINQSGSTLTSNADLLIVPSMRLGVVVLLNANPTELFGAPAGAADVALDVLQRSSGVGQGSTAPSVRTVYLVVDGLLLIGAAAFLVHLVRARTWRRRLVRSGNRRFFVVRSVVADAVLPLGVLIGVPLWVGTTGSTPSGDIVAGWRFVAWTLPDIAIVLFGIALGAAGIGLGKAVAVRTATIVTAS